MEDISRHGAVRWIGALQCEETSRGLRPSRIPPKTGYQLPDTTRYAAWVCSGVRLAFRSDTTRIRLAGVPLRARFPGYEPGPAVFDLRVDGALAGREGADGGVMITVHPERPKDYQFSDSGPVTVGFDGLEPQMKTVEVWLPHTAGFTLSELTVDAGAAVEEVAAQPGWIHYGSSISQCGEAFGPSEIWPAVAARSAQLEVTSLGFGGECHIDQFIARHIRDAPADLISLKLGINTYMSLTDRTYPPAVHGFLDTVRDGHPDTPVVLCSPIYCPLAETQAGPFSFDDDGSKTQTEPPAVPWQGLLNLQQMRAILKDIVAARRERGDSRLLYFSGLDLFGEADAHDLPDHVHPNGAGYVRMGERFAQRVLGDSGLLAEHSLAVASW